MSVNALLIGETILKDRTSLHTNIDPKLLESEIKVAQDMHILPILGTALYNKIVNDIDTTGTTTGQYKILLDSYIVDTLLYYVLAALPMVMSYQFWNKGVVRKQGDSTELPPLTELISLSDNYRVKAEWYGERLTKYLKQYSSSTFLPEYLQPGDTIDTIIPELSTFTMPIYLGDGYCSDGSIERGSSLDRNNCNC